MCLTVHCLARKAIQFTKVIYMRSIEFYSEFKFNYKQPGKEKTEVLFGAFFYFAFYVKCDLFTHVRAFRVKKIWNELKSINNF